MSKTKINKIVLAYSGGLDTSVIIPWLKENYDNPEIIAVLGHLGQDVDVEEIEARAKSSGASKLYIEDLQDEFVTDFIFPTLKAGAKYEGYLLGTSMARMPIAKRLVKVAKIEKADAVCHGCTGKGNDQVRFELSIKAFAPELKIIAPWREWQIKSRDEALEYAQKHGINLKLTSETNYSKDMNLWHLSHEGMDLESTENEPLYNKEGFLEMGVSPEKAPDTFEYVTLEFVAGIPTALNGNKMNGVALIKELNKIGGKHGIGLFDVVENRLVGMKSRGVYETPGGTILHRAHEVLETICLDKETSHYKALIAQKYAELVYNGQWYTPLREALDAFVDKTQERVTGEVKLKLYKGNIINAGTKSPYSLYSKDLASFNEHGIYNQADAAGFINLYGLPILVKALLDMERGN
ncbi:MAG: argininosuccinate synthase [Candidatus Bathyarchaeota archaeon]|nr:argininosuccinate synthase [Candidatus Termiticorpusculum sp.]